MDAGTTTTVGAAPPRVSAGQALAGVAVSVASSLLGTWVTTLFGEGTSPGVHLAGAAAGAAVPALVTLLLPAGRTHPLVALGIALGALGLTYTAVVTRDIITDSPEATFPTPEVLSAAVDGGGGGRAHNVAIDNAEATCTAAADGTWQVAVTVDWWLPQGVERPGPLLLAVSGEGWSGQREVSPGEGVDPREVVPIGVAPPADIGGSTAVAVDLTAEIDPDGRWAEDDEGDNTVAVPCGDGHRQLPFEDVAVVPESATCTFGVVDGVPVLDLSIAVAWVPEDAGGPEQIDVAAEGDGWTGGSTITVGDDAVDIQLTSSAGAEPPTSVLVTVTADWSGAVPESDEGDNQTQVSCPR